MSLGLRHLHARKRAARGLEAFPAASFGRRSFDYLMYMVGLVQPLALLPQVGAVYLHHEKAGISLATWELLTLFNLLWALYGFMHRDKPIMIANALLTALDIAIVLGVLYY